MLGLRAAAAEESLVAFTASQNAFPLAGNGAASPLFISANDWPGVLRAAGDLRKDIERVSGVAPVLSSGAPSSGSTAVLIGTIGRSALIDGLIAHDKIDVSATRGHWEAFTLAVVEKPLPGIDRGLVIAGSDKRGTIYGIYELSGEIGVSPWYWWADVPVAQHANVFVRSAPLIETGPTVKYRGIFLNDEAPALTGWAKEKFGGINHVVYEHVFELMLRLRANYLWPAMWNNAFNEDDPLNPKLADEYGIVMGTSHHEPMLRSQQEWRRHGSGPWNYATNGEVLRHFWADGMRRNREFESLVTIGMRGDGDEAMSAETNVALLEKIVADQRDIIRETTGRDPNAVPQLWALYKEVQAYYEHGMRVPDDVTLLWCDDNWGNIRRLPTREERARSGGAGLYYHFDYVGGPRNYKWLNTIPVTKIWEQMHLAWRLGANRVWIVNVGDLKPMEFPIEFLLRYAWRPADFPYEKLGAYSRAWAARQFGETHAEEIADLINNYTKLNGRRKPELLTPETFSLVDYREAERVLAEWQNLAARAGKLNSALTAEARAAFLQLVLHPIEACRAVNELYVSAGRNHLYAIQGRASANLFAAKTREWFEVDAALTRRWDEMLDGKWRHMMDQTHLGYTSWQEPIRNAMPGVTEIQLPAESSLGVAVEGDPAGRPGAYPISALAKLPSLSPVGPPSRWFDIFRRGQGTVRFSVESSQTWLRTSVASGELGPDVRVEVSVDWAGVPPGTQEGKITIKSASDSAPLVIVVPVDHRPVPANTFAEADGYIAIEAPHFLHAVSTDAVEWKILPDFGRTLGGVTTFPVTAPASNPGASSPHLEYGTFFQSTGEFSVELQCAPTLDYQPSEPPSLALSLDDDFPQTVKLDTGATNANWDRAVSDAVRRIKLNLSVKKAGLHVLKFWRVTPGVVLERIVIDTGGVRPSYLGPPETGGVR